MPSIKQIQNRLLIKNNSLNKVTVNVTKAEKSKNKTALRKLGQEKGSLGRDIRKLERQLVTAEKTYREKINVQNS